MRASWDHDSEAEEVEEHIEVDASPKLSYPARIAPRASSGFPSAADLAHLRDERLSPKDERLSPDLDESIGSELSARFTDLAGNLSDTSSLSWSFGDANQATGLMGMVHVVTDQQQQQRGRAGDPTERAAELGRLGFGHLVTLSPSYEELSQAMDRAGATSSRISSPPSFDFVFDPSILTGRPHSCPPQSVEPSHPIVCPLPRSTLGISLPLGTSLPNRRGFRSARPHAPGPTDLELPSSGSSSEHSNPPSGHTSPSRPIRPCTPVLRRARMASPGAIMSRIPRDDERPSNRWRSRPWHNEDDA
jgi:hypothetical protein